MKTLNTITMVVPGGRVITLTRPQANAFWLALGQEIERAEAQERAAQTSDLFADDADAAGHAEEQIERDQLAWAEGSRHRMPWAASDLNQPKT